MAELSPVETLRAAAEAARGGDRPQGGCWTLGRLGDSIGELLDERAYRLDQLLNGHDRGTAAPAMSELVDEYYAEALRVARVLLGVPDGR